MARKSTTDHDNNLLYGGDLGSEVSRRRVTMAPREERFTKKSDEAREMLSNLDLEQVHSSRAGPTVPPAAPSPPVEDHKG
ncbi:myocilin opposite strand protein [Felis catus]|uniref:Myocilin opposite strand n=1 Tax=Felis catus TaxID=9685 RepID=A0ABI7WDN2_FELCA|nr:myocilin opposite strand protein [Felis catus]